MNAYRRFSARALLLLSVLSLIWIFQCGFTKKSDHARYQAFREKEQELSSSQLVSKHAYQTRSGVRKDIWATEANGVRMHYRIESESSLLKLTPTQRKMELVENLKGIKCWMQDKLLLTSETQGAPLQQVRYLEADKGTYLYNTQKFDADTVSLFFLRLPGHNLTFDSGPKDAFLKGIAQKVSFFISEGAPQFQAQNFKASIKESEL